tara:strand:+ start:3886 stop:4161 length:276 start_codon:yes stop_codon:yes gene_type:complete
MDNLPLSNVEHGITYFAVGIIIGYASAKFLTGKTPQIKFWVLHVHHWIWATLIIIFLMIVNLTNPLLIGIFTGVAVEGLNYDDWSLIRKDK